MQRFVLHSLGRGALVLIGCLILVFMMVRITGDPVSVLLPRQASREQIGQFRHEMGLDRPVLVQFMDYAVKAATGDFGNSLHYRLPALPLILERVPATLHLTAVSLAMAVGIGIPLGLIGAIRHSSVWDWFSRTVGLLAQSTPSYWVGLVMIIVFAVRLGWFPASGRDSASSVIMPAFALSLSAIGRLVRLTRSSVLEILGEDYIRTAYSKGLTLGMVCIRHVLKNASIPLVSFLSVELSYMLTGSLIIETIFAWPGLGRLVVGAIGARDFVLVQAIALFGSVIVVVLNVLCDLTYTLLDPRIRYD